MGRSKKKRPRILGALLDALVIGLKRLPTIRLSELPRMADFAIWAREALIGEDYYVAAADETVKAFHARLRMIARERKSMTVILGDPENAGQLEEAMAANPSYTPPNMSRPPRSTLN